MLILSRVCAEFHDKSGAPVFTVTPRTRLSFQEAPESIREDPLFDMLLNDHSIEVADSRDRRKQLENDPEAKTENTGSSVPAGDKSSGRKPAEKKGS